MYVIIEDDMKKQVIRFLALHTNTSIEVQYWMHNCDGGSGRRKKQILYEFLFSSSVLLKVGVEVEMVVVKEVIEEIYILTFSKHAQ